MRTGTILGVLTIAAVVAVVVQRSAFREARAEHLALAAAQEKAEAFRQANAELETLSDVQSQIAALRESNRELPRLRNEVSTLRTAEKALQRLQAESTNLKARLTQPSSASPAAAAEFVRMDTLAPAGLATPPQAAQTFFWSLRQSEPAALLACVTPKALTSLGKMSPAALHKELNREFGKAEAYRIVATREDPDRPGTVVVGIQMSPKGESVLVLERVGEEWKLGGF